MYENQGFGKTALAVHWGHRVAHRFRDGQLYVNLRGFDPARTPVSPAEAVRGLLEAFQVPPQRIPATLDAQAALYRSLLAGKQMLVVLDNARDAEQVRPLLPGAPGCFVVVTSRNRLTGLVAAEAAYPMTLDLLPDVEAQELLVRRLGRSRVDAEPQAAQEIIDRCARLPLALSVVAARAATYPAHSLAALVDQLRDIRQSLDALDSVDPATDVRAVFSWSYHALRPDAARLFRLMGLHPGPDMAVPAVASLAGAPIDRIRPLLASLTRANLVSEPTPGRYALHDLLRTHAAELAHQHDHERLRHKAFRRLLDHYLHTASAAAALLYPHRDSVHLAPPQPGIEPVHLPDHQHALAWLTNEHKTLLAAIEHAAESGSDTHAWQLAWTMWTYLDLRGHWHDLGHTQTLALAAASRLDDRQAQAHAHRCLARAHRHAGRLDDAQAHLKQALDLFAEAGDHHGEGQVHYNISIMHGLQGNQWQALSHARLALKRFRTAGRPSMQAQTLNQIGFYHTQLGDFEQALTHCRKAVALLQRVGNRHGQAGVWLNLGYAHHHLGNHDQAADCYRRALDLYRDLGDRHGEADTLIKVGDNQVAGDPESARHSWQQALHILDELSHPDAAQARIRLDR
ncbi:MAG TPA: transcriptional regulator, SARP family protein [Micromonosporaceae bacterium]|nr:transcriptional regulator, SARP family protein [Micromonosporaceae bacterium]HCU50452.1 transcriptional regulator, SARP family protein [Micromonosporaceae bacterium]